MDIKKQWMEAACAYYSKWLGKEDILNRVFEGTEYVYSKERNQVQPGYGNRFDIYVLCREGSKVVSYGDRAAEQMDAVKAAVSVSMAAENVADVSASRRLAEKLGFAEFAEVVAVTL